ncbi:MAG: hypothetical protein J6K04_11010 [Lachnospiraceae bacterium]|nr:hypothetical protein [Lachnospiraceae bacterium]
MKYYFANNCYWDSEKMQMIRNDVPIDLPSSHTKILTTLLKNNGHFVSHEALYFAVTGEGNPYGDWKASLSNKFTRNKSSEKGLLVRVPEVEMFFEKSKSQIGGGYKLSVPKENIIDTTDVHINLWDDYRDVWHSKTYWESQQKKARVYEKDWLVRKIKLYLQGEQCSWPLVFAPSQYAPVKRDVINELIDEIENEIGAIVLTGAGGEGKTTILMQLCAELYNAGKSVFYHAPTHKYDIPDNVIDGIFLVDNPANTKEFKSFLTRATKEGLTVVIASRSNEWATLRETLFDDTRRSVKEIEIPKISSTESKAFAQYIKTYIQWIQRSTVELEKLFLKESYGFLYASMLMAIYNADSLEKIAGEIIDRVSKFENGEATLRILAAIVFAEQAGTGIGTRTYRLLCRHFSVDDRDVKSYLRKEVVLNGTVYQTRHEAISQLFYKYLFKDGDWWNYLTEEDREDVIIAVLDVYLREVEKSTKDYKPTEFRVIETSGILAQAFKVIDYEETQNFIIQRLLESCQQHGHVIIDRFYHHLDNYTVKGDLAMKCFERKLPLWRVYSHWLRYLSYDEKWFDILNDYIKTLCLDMNAPVDLWNLWIDIYEENLRNNSESVNKIREIYKLGLNTFANNAHWWISWASFEERHGNLGDIKAEYSARWLLREGCNCVQDNPHLWIKWAELETECENLGDIETKYSARWIAKEGGSKVKSTHLLIKRAELEESVGNIGEISLGNTARGILYNGITEFPQSMHLWIKWAELETRMGNIGDYETINSAAWIFKEACTNHGIVSDNAIWLKWADFAAVHNGFMRCSNKDEFSPSKILKCACIDHQIPSSQVWIKWANIEESRANIGNYDILYSAAWIYKEVCMRNVDDDDQAWKAWAYFVERNKNVLPLSAVFSLESVLKEKCLLGTKTVSPWMAWAFIEEMKGNIGDYSTEYSSAWLYRESCDNHNPTKDTNCFIKWAMFAQKHPMHDVDGELIDVKYVLEKIERFCLATNNQLWSDLADFREEVGYH